MSMVGDGVDVAVGAARAGVGLAGQCRRGGRIGCGRGCLAPCHRQRCEKSYPCCIQPRGSLHASTPVWFVVKFTRQRRKVMEITGARDDRDAIFRAVIAAAKGGDPTAMRLCVERLVPLRKGRPVVFDLPPVKTAADIAGAVGALVRAMAAGELTADEASAAASVIEMHRPRRFVLAPVLLPRLTSRKNASGSETDEGGE